MFSKLNPVKKFDKRRPSIKIKTSNWFFLLKKNDDNMAKKEAINNVKKIIDTICFGGIKRIKKTIRASKDIIIGNLPRLML